ncbi:uncharacterized protein Dwil_GK16765 [Drosophila willistoni]|uniref:NADH dehydrogenase [ubiquinone] 1 alpha subcomplex subunit 7 n=1 Tax=Drosophila willistoni TaxID=7260 RepID=B4MMA0_DROWI|nr:NADH dehydrogenase [ubiquinone] 1 alpha subcomplex subunit 7 [Drosophila willistoni]EDW73245.1 uncharacterized protein Dwil_GK16765 [Drosophila willistoni]
MPPNPKHRDLAPFLYRFRNFLLGRKHKTNNRYADTMSPRTQPPPEIPDGPRSPPDIHQVYYFSRDPRDMVRPPIDLVAEQKRQIAAKAKAKADAEAKAAKAASAGKDSPPAKGAPPPKAPPKDAAPQPVKSQEDCGQGDKNNDKSGRAGGIKKLPTPGKMHSWD